MKDQRRVKFLQDGAKTDHIVADKMDKQEWS